MTRRRLRLAAAAATLTLCASVAAALDRTLIPPHRWDYSVSKGVLFIVVGVLGAAIVPLFNRRRWPDPCRGRDRGQPVRTLAQALNSPRYSVSRVTAKSTAAMSPRGSIGCAALSVPPSRGVANWPHRLSEDALMDRHDGSRVPKGRGTRRAMEGDHGLLRDIGVDPQHQDPGGPPRCAAVIETFRVASTVHPAVVRTDDSMRILGVPGHRGGMSALPNITAVAGGAPGGHRTEQRGG